LTSDFQSPNSKGPEAEVGVLFRKKIDPGGGYFVVSRPNPGNVRETPELKRLSRRVSGIGGASHRQRAGIPVQDASRESRESRESRASRWVFIISDDVRVVSDSGGSFGKNRGSRGGTFGTAFDR
jgi:hypothetical protein